MELIPQGRYFHKGWEIAFFSEKAASGGQSSGVAEVRKEGELRCSLLSTGNFESRSNLFESLKARGIRWIDEHEARRDVVADWEESRS
ncbi:hypothetical protein [Variovorax paradoxus]|jgi:hypothetical protein|uniref:hypothetical protein n=1 Tax=Variovorax paradoxus TaxID=34073 RepID=UPI0024816908|nr:hypothetical protein [Variovorax paradoxus]WGT62329.1 hypothetical protein QHG62_19970 [Variovorax paradoxus]